MVANIEANVQGAFLPPNELPQTRPVNLSAVPQTLRALPQWVLWNWRWLEGWRKVPQQTNGHNAQTNNSRTWTSFDNVAKAYETGAYAGIGFCFSEGDGLQVVDLDHCISGADVDPWAKEILERFQGTFIERSPRDGLHIWFLAPSLGKATRSAKWGGDHGEKKAVEIFDHAGARFVCVTASLGAEPMPEPVDCKDARDWLCELYKLGAFALKASPNSDSILRSGDPAERALKGLQLETEAVRLREVAPYLKPNRDAWIRYGLALKYAGFSFEFFHELCILWPDYAGEADCLTVWNGLKPDGKIDIATIFYDAKLAGWQSHAKNDLPPELDKRWENFSVPNRYELTAKGVEAHVYKDGKLKYSEYICDHLAVTAKTKGVDGDAEHGLVLELCTLDETIKEIAIPRRRLHQDGKLLAQELAALNFRIKPGKEQQLLGFISDCSPTKELIAVSRTGWAASEVNQEKLVFVFPSGATDSNYRYQPERLGSSGGAKSAGTLAEWLAHVFAPVNANVYALYEILKALSAPLQKFAAVEGGEHLHGRTTTGKTTLIQIGASVWGCGADPSGASGTSYIHKWNTTANALEGLLSEHNDLPAYFDELGTYSGADFDKLVYNATSGAGKDAMDTSRNLKKRRRWRTLITSTGEISLINRIEEKAYGQKKTAKGGQLLRIVDRAIKENTFACAQQVDAVKRACAVYYGTLGQAFIENIIAGFTHSSFHVRVRELFDNAKERIKSVNPTFGAIQLRACGRFALAEVAGLLLVRFNLIPGLSDEWVRHAIDNVVHDWEPSSRQLDDGERAIHSLREFLLTHRDTRLKPYGFRDLIQNGATGAEVREIALGKVNRELAGYFDEQKKRYCLHPQALQEATGLPPEEAAKELDKRGLLQRENNRKKLQSRITVDGERVSIYAVSSAIIGGEYSPDDSEVLDFDSLI